MTSQLTKTLIMLLFIIGYNNFAYADYDFYIELGDDCTQATSYDDDGDVCAYTYNEYIADECYITWGDGYSSYVDPDDWDAETHHSYSDGYHTATFECKVNP